MRAFSHGRSDQALQDVRERRAPEFIDPRHARRIIIALPLDVGRLHIAIDLNSLSPIICGKPAGHRENHGSCGQRASYQRRRALGPRCAGVPQGSPTLGIVKPSDDLSSKVSQLK